MWVEVDTDGKKWRLLDRHGRFVATVHQWAASAWACVDNYAWNSEFVTAEAAKAECERRYFRWWMPWRRRAAERKD